MMFKVLLLASLAFSASQIKLANAAIEYPEEMYKANMSRHHENVFNGERRLSIRGTHDALVALQNNIADNIPRPTIVDLLVEASELKPERCNGQTLTKFQAFVESHSKFTRNVVPYLQRSLENQVAMCKQLMMSEIVERLTHIDELQQSLAELLRYVFFAFQDFSPDEEARIEILTRYVTHLLSSIELKFVGHPNVVLSDIIESKLVELKQVCENIEKQFSPIRKLLTVVGYLGSDELKQMHPNLLEWLGWKMACNELLSKPMPDPQGVVELFKHHSLVKETAVGRVYLGGQDWAPLSEWRQLKREIYNPKPEFLPSPDQTLKVLAGIEKIQSGRGLGEVGFLATNFEKQLIDVSEINQLKCIEFPDYFDHLRRRHHSEPLIVAYLLHFYDIQLEVCLKIFSQSIGLNLGVFFNQNDYKTIQELVFVTDSWMKGVVPKTEANLIFIIQFYASYGNEQVDSKIQEKLDHVRMLCTNILDRLKKQFNFYSSLDEANKSKLDQDSLVWMRGAEVCKNYLAILGLAPDSQTQPPQAALAALPALPAPAPEDQAGPSGTKNIQGAIEISSESSSES